MTPELESDEDEWGWGFFVNKTFRIIYFISFFGILVKQVDYNKGP